MQPVAPTVLVVEDEALAAMMLAARLSDEGYGTTIAPDGAQALRELQRSSFAAIVTDIRLPRMDGRALIRQLSQDGIDIPVFVMTGVPDEAKDLPVARVFAKPVDYDVLVKALAACLHGGTRRE